MKLLTKYQQEDMRNQMCQKARDIDICLFNAIDESMPKEYLLECLMLYEASDGGFAHGLHIDNYNINSSVYQVYEALHLLDLLDFDSNSKEDLFNKITNRCFNYLYNRAEMKNNIWNPNVKSNDDFAHSKLFSYAESYNDTFGIHPTPAIVGYTLTLCKKEKAYYKKAYKMLDFLIDYLLNSKSLTKYELISFSELLHSLKKIGYEKDIDKIENKIIKYAKEMVSTDFNDFESLKPFDVALELDDKELNELKDLEADYLISSIKSFGLWDYNGSWGWDKYPEFDSASLKWIGHITAINYYYLKKYGRIEK